MTFKQKYLSVIPVLILYLALSNCSCSQDNPVVPPPPDKEQFVKLSTLTVTCTEAFIKVSANDTLLPLNITLNRDDSPVFSFNLTNNDTTIIDTNLSPGGSYNYNAVAVINGEEWTGDKLQIQTLALTSHNFAWQTFTLGEPSAGSSVLNDVAIIDENNIWAVGEIYMNDSLGNPDPKRYNLAVWDGNNWTIKRVPYYYQGQPFYNPIQTVFAFGPNDIWFGGNGVIHWDGNQYNPVPIPSSVWGPHQINKIWGTSSNDLYIVGNDGKIAHYQSGSWSKIESGTTTNLNDVWGCYDKDNNEKSVLAVASNVFHTGEYRLLAISGNSAVDTLNWTYNDWLTGVWFLNRYSPVYICGDGVKVYKNNQWSVINLPNYFTEAIRGDNYNNVLVVGDFGFAEHFNGLNWQTIDELSGQGRFIGVAVKGETVVICGNNSSGGIVGNAIIIVGNQ